MERQLKLQKQFNLTSGIWSHNHNSFVAEKYVAMGNPHCVLKQNVNPVFMCLRILWKWGEIRPLLRLRTVKWLVKTLDEKWSVKTHDNKVVSQHSG